MSDMGQPLIDRLGDTWSVHWPEPGIRFGLDKLKPSSDGLKAEVVIESTRRDSPPRVHGPVHLNLLASRSQTELAGTLATRVNSLSKEDWALMVSAACAIVSKQWRAPSPLVDLATLGMPARPEFLADPLIPMNETTFIYGDGASLKSMFAMRIAISLQTGAPFPWGELPRRKCNVAYLDWETNSRSVHWRLWRLSDGTGLDQMPSIRYRGDVVGSNEPPMRSLEDEVPALREMIARERIDVVMMDSIGFAVRGSLNNDEIARQAIHDCRMLSPATRIVVAHISRESSKSSAVGDPFGSVFFRNGLRSGMALVRSDDSPGDQVDIGVYHKKSNEDRNREPFGLRCTFDGRDGPITWEPAPLMDMEDLAAKLPMNQRIVKQLEKGQATIFEIKEALNIEGTDDVIRATLNKLYKQGRVAKGETPGNQTAWKLPD